jgi:RNA polymerase sigma factor (sigma-70 family)
LSGDRGKAKISAEDWETLYRKYLPKLGSYFAAQGLHPTEAEDLAQDVFQELGHANVPEDPHAYIYAVARNMLSQHRRRAIAERTALGEYGRRVTSDDRRSGSHTLDAGLSEEAATGEGEQVLAMVAARLPAKDAELVILRFIRGLSSKQVAQRMNCSENAVRKRIRKLRPLLRRLLRA